MRSESTYSLSTCISLTSAPNVSRDKAKGGEMSNVGLGLRDTCSTVGLFDEDRSKYLLVFSTCMQWKLIKGFKVNCPQKKFSLSMMGVISKSMHELFFIQSTYFMTNLQPIIFWSLLSVTKS